MKRITTAALAVLTVLAMVFALAGCGEEKTVNLTVVDKGAKTEVEAKVGATVSEVLEKAEIILGFKDETEPAKDEKITEDTKQITVKRYAKVTVKLGDESKEVELTGGTVADAVKKSGFDTDNCTPDTDESKYLEDGMVITLIKGTKVTLTVDGKTADVPTKAKTVEEFLKEQKVTLGKDDEVSEKLTAEIKDGMKIVVKRVEYKTEEKTVTYKVKYVDGKEESREKTAEKVTKEPVDKVITHGTKSEAPQQQEPQQQQPQQQEPQPTEKTVVSEDNYPECDGSGHGYKEIHYSDGTSKIEVY